MNNEGFTKLLDILPGLFNEQTTVSIMPLGKSMSPTIKEGDKVYLERPEHLKKYDIVFFRNTDGKPILHRMLKKSKDGFYTMRGDSQSVKEKYITLSDIKGRVVLIERNGKKIRTEGVFFYIRSFVTLHLKYVKRIKKKAV